MATPKAKACQKPFPLFTSSQFTRLFAQRVEYIVHARIYCTRIYYTCHQVSNTLLWAGILSESSMHFLCESFIMEDNTPLLELPRKGWSLSRVSGPSLNPKKYWYILNRQLCGTTPTDFAKNEVFRCIPDEIRSVATRELRPATSKCTINRQPQSMYVASSFGLCAGVLRHREISKDGFVMTSRVTIHTINGIVLHADAKKVSTFGRKLTSDVK